MTSRTPTKREEASIRSELTNDPDHNVDGRDGADEAELHPVLEDTRNYRSGEQDNDKDVGDLVPHFLQ
jgi:hypothetical protein